MASLRLQPPDPLDFRSPDGWVKWKRRFEQYRIASGLATENDDRQISTLLYCMGEEAEAVLLSTNISAADRKKYENVMLKFDEFFKVRRNVIFERARFNRRVQKEGESADQFITALYELIETCEYGDLKGEMLRDRIVVGLRDTTLSERLQLDPDLTLEKAKRTARQKEAVNEHRQELQGDGTKPNPIVVEEVRSGGPAGARGGFAGVTGGSSKQGGASRRKGGNQCQRCGNNHTRSEQCPARNATCFQCHRKGHFGSQCFSKTVATTTEDTSLDTAFLGHLGSPWESSWTATIQLDDHLVLFKMDTGAEVTAISEREFQSLQLKQLEKPNKLLLGLTCQALNVIGQFRGTLSHKEKATQETIFVIRALKTNLLGLPAIKSLQLVQRIDVLEESTRDIERRFPKVFSGLGNLGDPYEIKLKEGARPYALYTPRNVSIPYRAQVGRELDRMQQMGVIERVEEPTQWCAGMVVVPKKSGEVRMCRYEASQCKCTSRSLSNTHGRRDTGTVVGNISIQ